VPFLKINFDTILTGLNITHGMTNRPHDIFCTYYQNICMQGIT